MDVNIIDDKLWQHRYKNIILHPLTLCDLPNGTVGRSLVNEFPDELNGVKSRKWNMERLLFFDLPLLQISHDSKDTQNMKKSINQYLSEWFEGKYHMQSSILMSYS